MWVMFRAELFPPSPPAFLFRGEAEGEPENFFLIISSLEVFTESSSSSWRHTALVKMVGLFCVTFEYKGVMNTF